MQSLKLVDGDVVFDANGDLVMIDGAEEFAQCLRLTLGMNKGEWFLNPELGIKCSAFLDKSQSDEEMREQIRQGLFQEPRTKTVEDIRFTLDRKKRLMDVHFVVTSIEGYRIEEGVAVHVD
ncbi:DUF2634 domain-containing protein [Brevibacterium sp. JNUCC-42]|nr:DUF2634 domain-containing protein [Brevibacterium sp. JNUCC-42]